MDSTIATIFDIKQLVYMIQQFLLLKVIKGFINTDK